MQTILMGVDDAYVGQPILAAAAFQAAFRPNARVVAYSRRLPK